MDGLSYLRLIAALLFVLALVGLAAWIARRYGFGRNAMGGGDRQLNLVEILPLDARTKLALIRRGDEEVLALIGASGVALGESRPARKREAETENSSS